MSCVWITGARGFVGRHLARYLAREGKSVAGVGHGQWSEHDAQSWGVQHWQNAEINGPNLDVLAARAGMPGVVFHLAGGSSVGFSLTSPLEDFERTVATTARLLEWVRVAAPLARIVLVSSAAVYGDGHTRPIDEASAPRPRSPYGTHKLMMEKLGECAEMNFALQVRVARLFSVYGTGLEKQLIWDICERIRGRRALLLGGTGQELRDWLHVADAVRLLVQIAEAPHVGSAPINGGTGVGTSVRDIAERVAAAWGTGLDLTFTGVTRPGDPRHLVADVAKARSIGFAAQVSLDDGLVEVVEACRKRARSS
jgi:UDP-glucose 4-epimerase